MGSVAATCISVAAFRVRVTKLSIFIVGGGVVIRWLLMLNKNTTENVCFGLLLVAVVGFIVVYCCLCDGLLVFCCGFRGLVD